MALSNRNLALHHGRYAIPLPIMRGLLFTWHCFPLVALVVLVTVSRPYLATLSDIRSLCIYGMAIAQQMTAGDALSDMRDELLSARGIDGAQVIVLGLVGILVFLDLIIASRRIFDNVSSVSRGLSCARFVLLWVSALMYIFAMLIGVGTDLLRQGLVMRPDLWFNLDNMVLLMPGTVFIVFAIPIVLFCGVIPMAYWSSRSFVFGHHRGVWAILARGVNRVKQLTENNDSARWLMLVIGILATGVGLPVICMMLLMVSMVVVALVLAVVVGIVLIPILIAADKCNK